MRLLGLSGGCGVGKDEVAKYLVDEKGFIAFSFSDALYEEVNTAYRRDDLSPTMDREVKETPQASLALMHSRDEVFRDSMVLFACQDGTTGGLDVDGLLKEPRSPRWILQRWGTAYRRAMDPDYWVKQAEKKIQTFVGSLEVFDKEGNCVGHKEAPGMVNTSVRFNNEAELLRSQLNGTVVHVIRPGFPGPGATYESEWGLSLHNGDHILVNNGKIPELRSAVEMMLQGNQVAVADCDYLGGEYVPMLVPRDANSIALTRYALKNVT